jgi:16S rRNA G966 N2-methylase RsmD
MSVKETKKLIISNIKNGEDFEFYPTTSEILDTLYDYMKEKEISGGSFLDIGAGNCKLFSHFAQRGKQEDEGKGVFISKYTVIEKSQTLINSMPPEALVIGTDFNENTLIDKEANVVFCNPPYSEYSVWAEKIIKETTATDIFLVIPRRWGKQRNIKAALKKREASITMVDSFTFMNSEDRKARANVALLHIKLYDERCHRFHKTNHVDPFQLWFNETFKIDAQKSEVDDYYKKYTYFEKKQKELKNEIVSGVDVVSRLVELYNNELSKMVSNYQKLGELDADLLKELNVDLKNLCNAFREKINGLKRLYWHEIFDNLHELTSRLTSKSRSKMVSELNSNTNIDFTAGNIRSVVIWAIKNANKYFDTQLVEIYDDFTCEEGIALYKSNIHWQRDTFRYYRFYEDLEKNAIRYALDYRIVRHHHKCFDYSFSNDFRGVDNSAKEIINDLVTVATNLGFSKIDKANEHNWFPSKANELEMLNPHFDSEKEEDNKKNPKWVTFARIKMFKNGNIHFQFNKDFIKRFNLEAGRLKGWLKSPQDAADEFDISITEAQNFWKKNFVLLPSNLPSLLPNIEQKETSQDIKTHIVENDFDTEIEELQDDTIESSTSYIDEFSDDALIASSSEDIIVEEPHGTQYTLEDKELFENGTLF